MRETKNSDKANGFTVIKVKVIPRSSRNQIIGIDGNTLKVKVTSEEIPNEA